MRTRQHTFSLRLAPQAYSQQSGRGFIGMRDFYQLLQLLRRELAGATSLSPELLGAFSSYLSCAYVMHILGT